jgi:hypothetical protein
MGLSVSRRTVCICLTIIGALRATGPVTVGAYDVEYTGSGICGP